LKKFKKNLLEEGLVDEAIKLSNHQKDEITTPALRAVSNFVTFEETRDYLVKHGIIEPLIVQAYSANRDNQFYAAKSFNYLSQNKNLRDTLVSKGVLDVLKILINNKDSEIQDEAIDALEEFKDILIQQEKEARERAGKKEKESTEKKKNQKKHKKKEKL